MTPNQLFSEFFPNTQSAHEAWSIRIGVKRELLCKVFGEQNAANLEHDIESDDRPAYLNGFGANVHYEFSGGNVNDPIMYFSISGHHPGEAHETLKRLDQANGGKRIIRL